MTQIGYYPPFGNSSYQLQFWHLSKKTTTILASNYKNDIVVSNCNIGEYLTVFACKNSPLSLLKHIPFPTILFWCTNYASKLHLTAPIGSFDQKTRSFSSCCRTNTCWEWHCTWLHYSSIDVAHWDTTCKDW